MPPKRKQARDLPDNLYPALDKRDMVLRYKYVDPRNGRQHGMGTDKAAAVRDANILNEAIYGKLAYSKMAKTTRRAPPSECSKPLGLKNPRYTITPRLRFEIFNRDNFTCRYCGRSSPQVRLHVDHVHPVSLGGSNELSNLVTACADCNLGKSNRTIYGAIEKAQACS